MGRLNDIALVEFVRKARDSDGLSWDEIEAALKKMGHTSRRFNKPIGNSDIRRLYLYGNAAYNRSQEKQQSGKSDYVPSGIPEHEFKILIRETLNSAALTDKTKIQVLKELVGKKA